MLGTAWRLMGDERDEILNGYERFIQVFDLEPPDGFPDMPSLNKELCAHLEGMHPPVRRICSANHCEAAPRQAAIFAKLWP